MPLRHWTSFLLRRRKRRRCLNQFNQFHSPPHHYRRLWGGYDTMPLLVVHYSSTTLLYLMQYTSHLFDAIQCNCIVDAIHLKYYWCSTMQLYTWCNSMQLYTGSWCNTVQLYTGYKIIQLHLIQYNTTVFDTIQCNCIWKNYTILYHFIANTSSVYKRHINKKVMEFVKGKPKGTNPAIMGNPIDMCAVNGSK